jgi:hypothetical protein
MYQYNSFLYCIKIYVLKKCFYFISINASIYHEKLVKIYDPDVKKLEKFLGYKIGWW